MPADNSGVSKWGWILPAVETALSMGFPTMMEVAVMRFLANPSMEAALRDPWFLGEAGVAAVGVAMVVRAAIQLRAAVGAHRDVNEFEKYIRSLE